MILKSLKGGGMTFLMRNHKQAYAALIIFFAVNLPVLGSSPLTEDALKNPADGYRPWLFYGWMGEGVTTNGLTADMLAFRQAGFGGALCYHDMGLGWGDFSALVDSPSTFMSDEWMKNIQFMLTQSEKTHLGIGLLNATHWDTDAGPWITPETAMKILTYSSTRVSGGEASGSKKLFEPIKNGRPKFYRDLAAYAVPAAPVPLSVSAGDGVDNRYSWRLNGAEPVIKSLAGEGSVLEIAFASPVTFRGAEFQFQAARRLPDVQLTLRNTATGEEYVSEECALGWKKAYGLMILNLPAIQADQVRIEFKPDKRFPTFFLREVVLDSFSRIHRAEYKAGYTFEWGHGNGVHSETMRRLFGLDDKSGGVVAFKDRQDVPVAEEPEDTAVLTDLIPCDVGPDGELLTVLPGGDWRVVRVGETLNGKMSYARENYLTADKFDPKALDLVYDNLYRKVIKGSAANGTRNVLNKLYTESWEQAMQNWSSVLPQEFRDRRGYDLTPYFPVLCGGFPVETIDQSFRFLSDFRCTIADCIAENYFGHYRKLCEEDGIEYVGCNTGAQQFMADCINYARRAKYPLGEYWVRRGQNISIRPDIKMAASAVHLYNPVGEQSVWGEGFTGPGSVDINPELIQYANNLAFVRGMTKAVFWTPHNPRSDLKPGMVWGPWFATEFSPTSPWWKYMDEITSPMQRTQHLLETGSHVADFVIYLGAQVPNYIGWRDTLSFGIPYGYSYDGCGRDAVLNLFAVQDGDIVCPNGTRYRALVLPDTELMDPVVLEQIAALVNAGATIIGNPPGRAIGLEGSPESDERIKVLSKMIWGDLDRDQVRILSVGKGRVLQGVSFESAADALGLVPDVICNFEASEAGNFLYPISEISDPVEALHRTTENGEIYFVVNNLNRSFMANVGFRCQGKVPEMFDPDTGTLSEAAVWTQQGDHTFVSVPLKKASGVFVLFREPAEGAPHLVGVEGIGSAIRIDPLQPNIPEQQPIVSLADGHLFADDTGGLRASYSDGTTAEYGVAVSRTELAGPWTVAMDPEWGGEESAVFDRLMWLNEHSLPGIKY